jgi:hypothetical protein
MNAEGRKALLALSLLGPAQSIATAMFFWWSKTPTGKFMLVACRLWLVLFPADFNLPACQGRLALANLLLVCAIGISSARGEISAGAVTPHSCRPYCGTITGPVSIVGSPLFHELGHHHLVHGRVGVSHAGVAAPAGLVQEAHGVGQSALFPDGGGDGRHGVL